MANRHLVKGQEAIDAFADAFPGSKAKIIVSAPGRVNIIGEHVDHCGYSVFPCAINQKVAAVCSFQEQGESSFLEIKHVDSKFTPKTFSKACDVKTSPDKHWTNYVVAAVLGVTDHLRQGGNAGEFPIKRSCKMLISGDVPAAAGLSSSSAVVVMAALVYCEVAEVKISRNDLADLCAKCERYVGTAGGGMDQASILLSKAGMAQLIDFNPLHTTEVPLPHSGVFVVTNTCKEAPKAVSFAKMYNKRVFELKTAAYVVLKHVDASAAAKLTGDELVNILWKQIVDKYLDPSDLKKSLAKVAECIEDRPYTKPEIEAFLGRAHLDYLLTKRCGVEVWDQNEDFYLFRRVRHVLTETQRVHEFVDMCKSQPKDEDELLKKLGNLLNEAGVSIRDDFDASCDEIEEVVEIAGRHGAYGARLTGAGWGGCTVALVKRERAEEFMQAMRKEYFEKKLAKGCMATDGAPLKMLRPDMAPDFTEALFVVDPAPGATVEYF